MQANSSSSSNFIDSLKLHIYVLGLKLQFPSDLKTEYKQWYSNSSPSDIVQKYLISVKTFSFFLQIVADFTSLSIVLDNLK